MSNRTRYAIALLTLSATAFVALTNEESFVGKAMIPTQGDRPTVGFGSTFRDDGSPVQMGDTITVSNGLARSLAHIQKDEAWLKKCVTGPLSHVEYNTLVNFSYQYGRYTACNSGMVRHINAGDYAASCEVYLEYRKSAGFDCSTPGNTICGGVWTRSKERHAACVAGL
jgi:lysozyme